MNDAPRSQRTAATALLETMTARGIRHVFANAGTDFAPLIEAMVQAQEAGVAVPTFHSIPHESVAMAMAHGYYLVSGEPAVVMVHVTVGTANALCGVMNASRDNAPIVLMAGHTPHTETGHVGSRNVSIHWGQDTFDQGGMLREYVKWDYELRAGQSVATLFGRALDIAMSEPRGPVYLTLPRETLADAAGPAAKVPPAGTAGAVPADPSADAVAEAAEWIAAAEFPLLLTPNAGRDPANVALLAELAERFAIAVGYPGEPGPREVSISTDHPMYVGVNPRRALEQADVIIALDCEVPWWPSIAAPKAGTQLVQAGPDPLFSRYPLRGFAADLAITGNSSRFLHRLRDALEEAAKDHRFQRRYESIRAVAAERLARNRERVSHAAARRPIDPAWVAECINRVKTPDTIIINELGVPTDLLHLTEPRTYLSSSPAGGLGFALGAALGARLAAPTRPVITVVGDGSYMFGNPVSAHFVARSEGLATVTVVMNNGRWHAVNRATVGMYPQGRAAAADAMPLVDLSPAPDFERIMQACGGHGERVEEPGELAAALARGMDAAAGGTPALINVITGV